MVIIIIYKNKINNECSKGYYTSNIRTKTGVVSHIKIMHEEGPRAVIKWEVKEVQMNTTYGRQGRKLPRVVQVKIPPPLQRLLDGL